ncbi:MAPEG family protein [Salinibius halmophilus]|uniref:MAPEG family protein n=1 Tax=Salinibius halmophilus TaxID=1853216 RepID=UPI000E6693D7|nr:MAPEG family protein [Salinibius halmophilus]
MTVLIVCLMVAAFLPYLAKVPLMKAMAALGGYDNNHPRAQQTALTGFGARALAGHQNAFESLAVFAPAVVVAIAVGQDSALVQGLAVAHVVLRVIYHVLYLANLSTARSLVWVGAILVPFVMLALCIPLI